MIESHTYFLCLTFFFDHRLVYLGGIFHLDLKSEMLWGSLDTRIKNFLIES